MNKTAFIALLIVIGIVLAFPQQSHSWGLGWVMGAAAAVVGVTLLGAAACPRYGYYGPPPTYAYPPPAYGSGYYGPRYYGYR